MTIVENGDAIVEVDVNAIRGGSGAPEHAAVELRFRHGQWVRTYPCADDAEPLPPGMFNRDVYEMSVDDAGLRAFRELWTSTGNCPDPCFYEVLESPWIVAMNAARFGVRHFVLVGHDMWLELLALDFEWAWSTRRATAIDLG